MKPRFNISLRQMVALTLVGAITMSGSFLLMGGAHLNRGHGTAAFWLRQIVSLIPLLIGGFLNIKGGSDLKDGIANQRWPQDEVAPFRGIFTSALWQVFSIGTMIVGCIMMFADRHPHDIAWTLFIFGQALSRMPWVFREDTANRTPPAPWNNAPPLQSDHWGGR
jgi:hypothetical protein